MKRTEAIAALDSNREVKVRTRSGAEYNVAWDILESDDAEYGYVYGYRTNGSIRPTPFKKKAVNGAIRWFDLKHVQLVHCES